jgi:MOSC domain-containing protein YiiM
MSMTLVSINVGMPRDVPHGDGKVATGIFKQPVEGRVKVGRLHLEGDGQADLKHHGGVSKAVYAYSLDHYPWWSRELGRNDLVPGQFGENFTIAGLDEANLCVGDRLAIGDALFTISQPRVPCFKLGLRFEDRHLPRLFAEALRPGIYLQVLREGSVVAGDAVERVAPGHGGLSIRRLFEAFFRPNDNHALQLLAQALEVAELSDEWREHIQQRLERRASPAG